jgi:hypothetical protein
MKYNVGTIVDLYDSGFKQWRGEYIIAKIYPETGLYKIKNTKTGSQQTVREKALRIGRLKPFRIESLHAS